MHKSHTTNNTDMLIAVCHYLQPLLDQLVLVGGCATSLLITDKASPDIRPTIDVDLIVDVISLADYYQLEKKLRDLGFTQGEDDDGIICRWTIDNHIVDIMPSNEKILGFSNPWYQEAIKHSVKTKLNNELQIRHITSPYFLATKLIAFQTRGNNDYGVSHDMEDIIMLIDGRPELVNELENSNNKLKTFLADQFSEMLSNNKFTQTLSWHLPSDTAGQAREPMIIERIKKISNL